MNRSYTTQDLIEILAAEQRACLNGQRLHLADRPSLGINPLIDRFIEPSGFQTFAAYEAFRQTIHTYQREHQVSGLIWQSITIDDRTLEFPRIHEQLISLSTDRQVLRSAKRSVLAFWQTVTAHRAIFLSTQGGKHFQPVTPLELAPLFDRSEWAILQKHGQADRLEIILQLGWGKPEEATYPRSFPESGSEFIHAVTSDRIPLG